MAHKIATDEEIIEIDVDQDDEAKIEENNQTSESISLTQQQNSINKQPTLLSPSLPISLSPRGCSYR